MRVKLPESPRLLLFQFYGVTEVVRAERFHQEPVSPSSRAQPQCRVLRNGFHLRSENSEVPTIGNSAFGRIGDFRVAFHLCFKASPGVNSIKKYKCTLQVGPLFLQIHTSLQLALTMVFYWIQSVISRKFTCALCSCKKLHL